jgi:hypothetical protein
METNYYGLRMFAFWPRNGLQRYAVLSLATTIVRSPQPFRLDVFDNRILGVTGQPYWQDESYDRLVRSEMEFQRIARYIEMNPVSAALTATPEEFPWSSAGPIDNRPQVANLPPTVVFLNWSRSNTAGPRRRC